MKMESATPNRSFQPRPLAELLPELSSILSRDSVLTLTARKQPRNKLALTRTAVKDVKPLTIAEMKADLLALKVPSPRRFVQPSASTKKRIWNSSVKVENKIKSRTASGQLKNNSVRKALEFPQPKPKVLLKPKVDVTPATPKFPKPEFRAKKSVHVQAKNVVRISGISNMPETPQRFRSSKVIENRITQVNKENFPHKANINRKPQVTPLVTKKSMASTAPIMPPLNMSWKSDTDNSFLLKEKEVQDTEDKVKTVLEEQTLVNTAEVSTPFKDHRNIREFFNHSNYMDNSALYNDNTIMCFDETPLSNDNKREESVIVSLCDMFNKASVTNVEQPMTGLSDLLQVEKQLEHNIEMVENGIKMLSNIKDSEVRSLEYVKRLINEKKTCSISNHESNNSVKTNIAPDLTQDKNQNEIEPASSKACSVIKLKSPSYKIPKKTQCLRKRLLYKSMPNIPSGMITPKKDMDKRAFDMYMEMKTKDQMSFLNTPCVKKRNMELPDTPTVTSHNLQFQLERMFKDNT